MLISLSRKPLVQTNLDAQIDDTTNNVLNIETIPFNVSNDEMVREIRKGRILSVVYDCLLKGRELPQSAEFLPYMRVKDQLNIDKECVLKANRVIVPVKLKDKVLHKCFTVSIWAFRRQKILLDIMFGGPKLMKISNI